MALLRQTSSISSELDNITEYAHTASSSGVPNVSVVHFVAKILVLHGPNLNLLGKREPDIYGRTTLPEIDQRLATQAQAAGHVLEGFQSNAEYALVDRVQQSQSDHTAFILCNAGALTHTSVALRDALVAVAIPFIEVHLSNVYAREPFRHHSYLSDIAVGVICGFGADSYRLALDAAIYRLRPPSTAGD